MIRIAYRRAGLSFDGTDYVEVRILGLEVFSVAPSSLAESALNYNVLLTTPRHMVLARRWATQ